jgi:hypothetical protein
VSRDGLDPLGPELESLLQAERLAPSPSESLDRVWARVAVSLAGGGASGQGGHGGATRAVTSGAWLGRHARAAVIAAFALGGASGAALVVALRPAAPGRVVYLEKSMAGRSGQAEEIARAAPPAEPISPTAIAPSASAAVSLQPVPLPPTRPAVSPSGSASSASLAAERLLLDQARTALSAGDTDQALASTDIHARRFAHPQLGEEREALGIQALVGGGRYDEARARAARFRATWPNSLFLPAVDASIASIP